MTREALLAELSFSLDTRFSFDMGHLNWRHRGSQVDVQILHNHAPGLCPLHGEPEDRSVLRHALHKAVVYQQVSTINGHELAAQPGPIISGAPAGRALLPDRWLAGMCATDSIRRVDFELPIAMLVWWMRN